MSIKGLLFSLSMYIGLVWVGGAYLNPGPNSGEKIRQFGLFWTGAGLAAVLILIAGAKLFSWWRVWRAKPAAPKSVAAKKAEPAIHEDDASLLALIAEANAALANAPGYTGTRKPIATLPVYLLIGPESSGKTSTFVNSGLTPQLLAGQITNAGLQTATRIANIWLVQGAIFIEIAGRLFSGDVARWTQILRVIERSAKDNGKGWRPQRFWQEPEPGLRLSGVMAFCEAKEFTATLNPDRIARDSRAWQERLAPIGEVFGIEYPVYQVITKCDSIGFFDDYFRRIPESEAQQVLGCTIDSRELQPSSGETFADVAAKRLSALFNTLYYSLAERRLAHLAHEPNVKIRPGVYEFPRELKRIRPALVQFLVEAFRPNPLKSGPVLRGYYFTGTREVESVAVDPGATRTDWTAPDVAADATRLFRGDATQFLRPDDVRSPVGRGTTTRRWMFAADLIRSVVLADRPARRVVPVNTQAERYRRLALSGVCGICALLCLAWSVSWAGNRKLLNDIEAVSNMDTRGTGTGLSLEELRALDALRLQTGLLAEYDRSRPPLSLRWGLYAGESLADPARRTYFRRFEERILKGLDASLLSRLQALPANPSPNDSYDPVYRTLATHLMISTTGCKPDTALVAQVLKQTADQANLATGAESNDLVRKQIDFYASELKFGNPCPVDENAEARDRGRQYLANVTGIERTYAAILANVERSVGSPERLSVYASNYATVLNGPGEVSGAFTLAGWAAVEKAAAQGRAGEFGDSCVIGPASGAGGSSEPSADLAAAIRKRYARDYVERWRAFVSGFSVSRYASAEDAARKLDILADHRSPLLAVLYMTSKQTSFPSEPTPPQGVSKYTKPVLDMVTGVNGDKNTGKGAAPASTANEIATPADISRTFQPVQVVVPAQSETWVTDKNAAYVESLAQLGHAMRDVAKANTDPAVQQAAAQAYDKATDSLRQLARSFNPVGVQGIDAAVEHLLEQPIQLTRVFLVEPDKAVAAKVNGELRAMCSSINGTLRRYPFSPSGEDASLQDVAHVFAPGTGAIWSFQSQSLADFVARDGSQWKSKDPAKKPQVTPEMLNLLNHAQKISDVFYAPGSTQPLLTFTFRPKMDSKEATLQLQIDAQKHEWTSSLQKQFTWPAPPGTKDLGAVARMRIGPAIVPVASRGGVWGIFRVMADAEPRPVGSRLVEWKKVRGGGGRLEPIEPPARLEIVEFPGGVDVFNPRFFEGFQCPARAVQ